jgi:hypothetical protein
MKKGGQWPPEIKLSWKEESLMKKSLTEKACA